MTNIIEAKIMYRECITLDNLEEAIAPYGNEDLREILRQIMSIPLADNAKILARLKTLERLSLIADDSFTGDLAEDCGEDYTEVDARIEDYNARLRGILEHAQGLPVHDVMRCELLIALLDAIVDSEILSVFRCNVNKWISVLKEKG